MSHNNRMPFGYTKVFREMLIADTIRGDDSTGMCSLVGKKKLTIFKEPYDGVTFVYQRPFISNIEKNKGNHKFLLGHNRAATVGSIDKDSAHPFLFSGLCGVHNGTIYDFGKWENKDLDMHNYKVDSQQLYYLINKYGLKETLDEVNGAYALSYYDIKNKSMNFVRNSERPLWFAHTHEGMFWASERDMLEWILRRNRIYSGTYEMLPEHTLWSFDVDDTKTRRELKDVGKSYTHRIGTNTNTPATNRGHLRTDYTPPTSNTPTIYLVDETREKNGPPPSGNA